ncbi:MAG: hypothetical protein Kow00129_11810 [Thermoleophilia bacterium]
MRRYFAPSDEPCPRNPHFPPQVERHLAAPEGAGRLSNPSYAGEAGSRECGDLVRIELEVRAGRIVESGFQAYGCPAAIAGGSAVAGAVRDRSFLEAAGLGEDWITGALGYQTPGHRRCPALAVDALHEALRQWAEDPEADLQAPSPASEALDEKDGPAEPGRDPVRKGVLVGMSGGVDSSVAALMLSRADYRVVGVTFLLWSDPACGLENSCCSPEGVREARRAAHQLGIPHFTLDLSGDFYAEVVEYFVEEYRQARTPNPCVRCNASIRFRELARLADRLGLEAIATGHYARVETEGSGRSRLRRGVDPGKDQSYVLAQVPPELLARLELPLGGLRKEEVRHLAAEAGIRSHARPESQDICFVPDDDYRRFLRERLQPVPGPIVDTGGRRLGSHAGLHNFTIGQRKGLGIAAGRPLYVTQMRSADRALVVGTAEEALADVVEVLEVVRHRAELPAVLEVQLRSSGEVRTVRVAKSENGRLKLLLDEPVRGAAPGQQAVLYDGVEVVAAGTILAGGRKL